MTTSFPLLHHETGFGSSARILRWIACLLVAGRFACGQVISEIHYHPPDGEERFEFVEVANDSSTPIDLSGYAFVEGISFTFPAKTLLSSNERIVVCADVEALQDRHPGIRALGNFSGRLDNRGERLTLSNHAGVVVSSVRFDDDGKWPVAPDGSGHTLELRNVRLLEKEPESWAPSPFPGGSPGAAHSPGLPPDVPATRGLLQFNELLRDTETGGWVEIHNGGNTDIDASRFRLSEDGSFQEAYLLPAGSLLSAGGYLVVEAEASGLDLAANEVRLFLHDASGQLVAAHNFAFPTPSAAEPGRHSECRFPDGGRPGWVSETPTPGAPNQVEICSDIVINEIFYHPPEDRPGEFIELYNRGLEAIDLSGFRFSRGIDFSFPDAVSLSPGEYLVLTDAPELLAEHHDLHDALGPYDGSLANRGENVRLVDELGNLVDEVRYFDGGRWSLWADGKGASLELIDPRQDNDFATAWAASDESETAAWEELSFTAPDFVPRDDTDVEIRLAERGICLLDDVSVVRTDTDGNLIVNPGFEADSSAWLLRGNHGNSDRTTRDSHSGVACLELIATGKGDNRLCNQIETQTSPVMKAGSHAVSLWARWQRGTSLVFVNGQYTSGPWGGLSSNSLSAALRLTVPWDLGTPGEENSVRRQLRDMTLSENLGPVIGQVEHSPPSPLPDAPALITARVSDSDGLARVEAVYREGDARGEFSRQELTRSTRDPELFSGELPGFPVNTKIVFFIEATDSRGAVHRFPAEAPERTCLYQVARDLPPRIDYYRIILDDERTELLARRPLTSNEMLDGAFVFNNEKAVYNVEIRHRGAGSRERNFRVRFPKDDRLHGHLRDLNVDRKTTTPVVEGAAYFLVERNGSPSAPTPTPSYRYVGSFVNGQTRGIVASIQTIDRGFIETWLGDDAAREGIVLKAVGRSVVNDACLQEGYDGADLAHRDAELDRYRGYWTQTIHQTRDQWEPFVELTRIADRSQTPDTEFPEKIAQALDVEEFFRVVIPRLLVGDFDSIFVRGGGHNGYIAYTPRERRWKLLPFDIDKAFEQMPPSVFPSDGFTNRLLEVPPFRRLYLRLLGEFVEADGPLESLNAFLDAVAQATRLPVNGAQAPLGGTAEQVREAIEPSHSTPFAARLHVDGTVVWIEGTAPVQVEEILVRRDNADAERLAIEWLTVTHWRIVIDAPELTTQLEVSAHDTSGALFGVVTLHLAPFDVEFVRGDVNQDARINLVDMMKILGFLFRGGALSCLDAADLDDNGDVGLSDVLAGLSFLFRDGSAPPPPFPEAGRDPTPDALECPGT